MQNILFRRIIWSILLSVAVVFFVFALLFGYTMVVMTSAQYHAITSANDLLAFLSVSSVTEPLIILAMCFAVCMVITLRRNP